MIGMCKLIWMVPRRMHFHCKYSYGGLTNSGVAKWVSKECILSEALFQSVRHYGNVQIMKRTNYRHAFMTIKIESITFEM